MTVATICESRRCRILWGAGRRYELKGFCNSTIGLSLRFGIRRLIVMMNGSGRVGDEDGNQVPRSVKGEQEIGEIGSCRVSYRKQDSKLRKGTLRTVLLDRRPRPKGGKR
jgi:hypothetical protein